MVEQAAGDGEEFEESRGCLDVYWRRSLTFKRRGFTKRAMDKFRAC